MNTLAAFLDTNSRYSVLRWEPVPGSGERINVAVVCEHAHRFVARTLVRDDVLRSMYGTAGDGVMRMVEQEEITLSDKQRDRLRSNVMEIQQEASHRQVKFHEVHTVPDAANAIIAMA